MRLDIYLIRANKATVLLSLKSDAIVWKITLKTDSYCLTIIQFQIYSCNRDRFFAPSNLSKNMKNELFLAHQFLPGKQNKGNVTNIKKSVMFSMSALFSQGWHE